MGNEEMQSMRNGNSDYYDVGDGMPHEVLDRVDYKSSESQNQDPYCGIKPTML